MIDATLIADLIRAGLDPELVGRVVNALMSTTPSGGHRVDTAGDRRREWDRDRKRATRHLRLPESEWIPLVHEILKRDGHKCTYCGATDKLTADHVEPMSRGGTHDPSNLVACCIPCNTKKGNKLLSEWLPNSADIHRNPPDTGSALSFLSPSTEVQKEKGKKERSHGSKIPPDWKPNVGHFAAGRELGFTESQVLEQAEDMRLWAQSNEHRAVARKSDWDMTFLSWLRRNKPKQVNGHGKPARQSLSDAADDLISRAESRDCETAARSAYDLDGSIEGGEKPRRAMG